jgi:hypothetical protein
MQLIIATSAGRLEVVQGCMQHMLRWACRCVSREPNHGDLPPFLAANQVQAQPRVAQNDGVS